MAQGKISSKQQEILDYIKSQILERGFPPAVRDICEAVHLKSTSSVHSHLETLEKNGYIRRDPTKPRAIEILDDSFAMMRREMTSVPIIGHVVQGESMVNAGILNGDLVLVKEQHNASNGEMVVALIEDGATVKTFYKENGYIRLQPENDYMDPIIVPDVTILGKVIGVFRFFE